jgi:ACT domain-containing protein
MPTSSTQAPRGPPSPTRSAAARRHANGMTSSPENRKRRKTTSKGSSERRALKRETGMNVVQITSTARAQAVPSQSAGFVVAFDRRHHSLAETSNRIIVTVVGQDRTGIIAETSRILADSGVNIVDISQTLMGEFFVMIMMADLSGATVSLEQLKSRLAAKGTELGMRIDAQHEDVFKFMHRV